MIENIIFDVSDEVSTCVEKVVKLKNFLYGENFFLYVKKKLFQRKRKLFHSKNFSLHRKIEHVRTL